MDTTKAGLSRDIDQVITTVKGSPLFALDLETTSLDTRQAKITYVILATTQDCFVLPLSGPDALPYLNTLRRLGEIFEDDRLSCYMWNGYYDLSVLRAHHQVFRPKILDGMIGWKMLDERRYYRSLKDVVREQLGRNPMTFEQVTGFFGGFGQDLTQYAYDDGRNTFDICDQVIAPRIEQEGMRKTWELEGEVSKVTADMTVHGILVDQEHLRKLLAETEPEILRQAEVVKCLAKTRFDPSSAAQTARVLWVVLGLGQDVNGQGLPTNKSGLIKTDDPVLELIANRHPVVPALQRYRELEKFASMIRSLLEKVGDDGRVHATCKQCFSTTARMQFENPNIQQVTKEPWDGLRNAFVAQKGCVLVQADLSQIELRLLAWRSEDDNLVDAYVKDQDIHAKTAELVGCDRREAKTLNFGVLYRMGVKKLANRLNISIGKARVYRKNFLASYPGIDRYYHEVLSQMLQRGFVKTFTGRRRHVSSEALNFLQAGHRGQHYDPDPANRCYPCSVVSKEHRENGNFCIQSGQADLLKIILRNFSHDIWSRPYPWDRVHVVNVVHDEIILECPESIALECRGLLVHHMENAIVLKTSKGITIPIKTDAQVCRSWGEASLHPTKPDSKNGLPSRRAVLMGAGVEDLAIRNVFGIKDE